MGFAPTWFRQVSPLLHKTTLTTAFDAYPDDDADPGIFNGFLTVGGWRCYKNVAGSGCLSGLRSLSASITNRAYAIQRPEDASCIQIEPRRKPREYIYYYLLLSLNSIVSCRKELNC